jgi:hypothetical protein
VGVASAAAGLTSWSTPTWLSSLHFLNSEAIDTSNISVIGRTLKSNGTVTLSPQHLSSSPLSET